METPEWLAPEFGRSFLARIANEEEDGGKITDCSGLLKPETKQIWKKLESDMWDALFRIPNVAIEGIAGSVVGAFCTPLAFGYGGKAKSSDQDMKQEVRKRQTEADKLKEKAIKAACKLADVMEELQGKTPYLPDAVFSFNTKKLRELCMELEAYPRTRDLFAGIPEMASQKSSFMDWLLGAKGNLKLCNRMYRGGFELSEAEWDILTRCLFDATRREGTQLSKRNAPYK